MVKKVIFLLILMSVLPLLSAESIGEYQLDIDDVEIFVTCNNCTDVNFTRLMGPNNQTLLSNLVATQDGTYYFYVVDKGNLTQQGLYQYCYDGGNADARETGCNNFLISYTGKDLTLESAIIYISLMGFLSFLFILLLTSISWIPNHKQDEQGMLVEMSSLAFFKPIVIGGCWIVLMAMLYLSAELGIAYTEGQGLGILLFRGWQILMAMTLIALPLWIIGIVQMWARNKTTQDLIERGVEFR